MPMIMRAGLMIGEAHSSKGDKTLVAETES